MIVILDSKEDILLVLVSDTREADRDSWEIDMATRTDECITERLDLYRVRVDRANTHMKESTIDLHHPTHYHILHEIWIVTGQILRSTRETHICIDTKYVSFFVGNLGRDITCAELWTLGIEEECERCRSTRIQSVDTISDLSSRDMIRMRKIESDDVDSAIIEGLELLG